MIHGEYNYTYQRFVFSENAQQIHCRTGDRGARLVGCRRLPERKSQEAIRKSRICPVTQSRITAI